MPVKVTVNPVNGDDGSTIQAAIDQVSLMLTDANGFRAAVLLKPGEYQVEGNLTISTSGVVLRGGGQGSVGCIKIIYHSTLCQGCGKENQQGYGGFEKQVKIRYFNNKRKHCKEGRTNLVKTWILTFDFSSIGIDKGALPAFAFIK